MKKINKEQIISFVLSDEKMMEGLKFFPATRVVIPFTNIVWSESKEYWAKNKGSIWIYCDDELNDYIVRGDVLYRKPRIKLSFASGWRDDVIKYFDTKADAEKWISANDLDDNNWINVD